MARRAPRDARVVLQRRKAGRWATLGRSRLVRARFRFTFKAPASSSALTLTVRVLLVRGRRQLRRSPTRRIVVGAPARIPAPVSAPAPAPPPSSPPEPDIDVTAPTVRMTPGSTMDVVTPAPLTSITELEPGPTGAAPGVSLRAAQGRVIAAASRQSVLGETSPKIRGTGCTTSECGRRFVMRVPVTVLPTLAAMSWSDEFDGSALDLTRWSYRASGPRFDATVTPEAVSVGDGALTIKTYTEEEEHYVGMIGSYLHPGGGFEQTYGYFEARMKFNNAPGQWSAFWLQSPTLGNPLGDPATAGVEMDIAEHRTQCVEAPAPTPPQTCSPTNDISDRIQQALIWDGYGPESKSAVKLSDPLAGLGNGSWHTWSLRWTPTDVTFYYDGVPTWSQTQPISRRDEYMILSSDVGEFFAGAIPAGGYGSRATTTTKTQVDYVRVWPLAEGTSSGG
jgi:beta-glucanase (GH16 family)